jgi:hypothetical protein
MITNFIGGGLGRRIIRSPNMIRVSHLKPKDSFLGLPNSLFSLYNLKCVKLPFYLISNEVNLLQISCRPLEYLLFSLMKVNNNIYPYGLCFYQWPKILKNFTS